LQAFAQLFRRRPEAVLQYHAQLHVSAGPHQLLGARGGNLERLLEQDVLAGRGAARHELQMRIRRREQENGIDRAVLQDGVELAALREGKALGEASSSFRRRTIGIRNLHAMLEIEQAAGMRGHRHAKPDQRHALHLNP
jgi:hypothetical protein